jgi:hypothetical protein
MAILKLRRRIFPIQWALFAFAFLVLSLSASDASAQSGGIHGYFERFYGRDFYDGQHNRGLIHRDYSKQYHGGFYSPPMMYGRQYADEYGYRTDPAFWFPRPNGPSPYSQGYTSRR